MTRKDKFIIAQMLIEEYGAQAEEYAHGIMLEFIEEDDVKEASFWLEMESLIEDLRITQQKNKLH